MHFIKAAFVALLIADPYFALAFKPSPCTRTPFIDRRGVKLQMVGEIVEGANAAFNVLPLLAGPTAALAAGQAALSQKKKIESEVEYAERELDEVKRKLKNTDTLINGSFGLAVVSAGFVAVQAFSGETSFPQTNIESIEEPQELVLPSSSQQLAIENQRPSTESIKELKKVETTPEKKSVTSESDYNSLYKSIESAGKAVGETVENNKAAASISQLSKATASDVKDLSGGKVSNDILSAPTKITVEKTQAAAPSIALKDKVEDSASKALPVEKSFPMITLENKNSDAAKIGNEKVQASPSISSNEKIVDESVTKNSPITSKESSENKLSSAKATNDAPQALAVISSTEKIDESFTKTPPSEKVLTDMAKDNTQSKKANDEVTLSPTELKEGKIIKEDVSAQTKAAPDITAEKILTEKSEPNVAVKVDEPVVSTLEKGSTSKTDISTATMASTEKIDQASTPKSATGDEKSLAQNMEAAGKAGSDLVQPTISTDKQSLDSSPTYDSLFKKIEAAGKAPDESSKSAEKTRDQVSSSESNVLTSSSAATDGSTSDMSKSANKDAAPDMITSTAPSFSSADDAPQDATSDGVYMKEAVSALSSLGLPKLNRDLSNSPDYKLPTFNGPDLAMPEFNMPDLKIPTLNIPELSIPDINLPSMEDIPLAAKVAAGVVAVGGTGVAIAYSLSTEETMGSTMPIGAKKKGSSYLEGLSRSSTTLPNKAANGSSSGSNSYLNNLAANAAPTRAQTADAPFDFSPKPFDPSADSPSNNARPTLTAVQESNVSPSFNFAPSANANKESSQFNIGDSENGGITRGAPNGEKKNDSSGPSFNFSPKLFDLANKRGSAAKNGQDTTSSNVGPKPEPPMGGESLSDSSKSDKYDWGNTSVDGGYVWRDPVQQKPGSGVGSYLDNLASKSVGPNPYTNPTNPNGGSYNSYLDAMNGQPNQQYQDSNQPSTVKTFSKTPRTGSYVDSL